MVILRVILRVILMVILRVILRYNMSDYSIKLGDSVGSGVHVHSQGEIYPVIQMYIGQEKVFTYANKVLPYSMKQQVLDAVADGTPAIRALFSTSTRELCTF